MTLLVHTEVGCLDSLHCYSLFLRLPGNRPYTDCVISVQTAVFPLVLPHLGVDCSCINL